MKRRYILLIDAIVNFILGIFLLLFPHKLVQFLGLPLVDISFYPSILGAILFGIAIALLIENYKKQQSIIGLGLVGAIVINICGGIVLAFWLLFGNLDIPLRGYIILWGLVAILVFLSSVEFGMNMKGKK
jgi:uncharacterized membrane protein